MSTISETYNYAHNILELAGILPNVYFTTNMKRNYLLIKMLNMGWLKSGQSTQRVAELLIKSKISKLHEIIV